MFMFHKDKFGKYNPEKTIREAIELYKKEVGLNPYEILFSFHGFEEHSKDFIFPKIENIIIKKANFVQPSHFILAGKGEW